MNTLLLILSMMLMSWSKPADGPSGSPGASGGVVAADGPSTEERARFARAADYSKQHVGHAVLIQRAGSIIFERYEDGWTGDRAHPLASGTKSFTGVAAMFAVQDGLLTLDERVSDTITEWKSDPKKSKITVRQLLDLSSGLEPGDRVGPRVQRGERIPRAENAFADALKAPGELEPGTRFRYGPTHFYAFGALLERKLAASSLPVKKAWDYYELRIFKPLGMEIGRIGRDRTGNPNLPGGAMVSARQWVKFGEFVLRNGKATITSGPEKGSRKQLLEPELLAECFVPSKANAAYGLTWWLR
ncbi:MAG: serine hydrolase, partial [Phycisphaerales bacterium]|nr:serine hydrolase [Phycisphaerales bacterium]